MDQGKQGRREPVEKIRRGSIEAAIWENENGGRVWHNVSIYRRYKTEKGEFREASNYALADLVQVGRIAQMAEEWITKRLDERTHTSPEADVTRGARDGNC